MSDRSFLWYDVFTDRPFTGNPLAVFPDARGLDDETMRRIARELNLSETTFVTPPDEADDESATHHVRIFTPSRELAFAGHPTVGTAVALAELAGADDVEYVFGLGAGPTPVRVQRDASGVRRASLVAPKLPRLEPAPVDLAQAAAMVGIEAADIDEAMPLHVADAGGTTFLVLLVRSLDVLARCRPVGEAEDVVGIYVATPVGDGFQSRMFATASGVTEDPATGSATVAFAGSLVAHVARFGTDGAHEVSLRQGVEMGRPSELALSFDVSAGALTEVRLAGAAVHVLSGTLPTH